jgi:drug/metabolite transporter (DMT)-like permease
MRYCGGFAAAFILACFQRRAISAFRSQHILAHFARAVFGATGVVLSLYAATHMPLNEASAIGLTQGVFILVFGITFLAERVGPMHWLAEAGCMTGALVVVLGLASGASATPTALLPAAAALLAAFLIAAELALVKALSGREKAITAVLYVNLFGALLLLVPSIDAWNTSASSAAFVPYLLGPIAIIAQYFNIRGFRSTPVTIAGPIGYSRLIFAGLLGVLIFGEWPTPAAWIGGTIVLIGGIALARVSSRSRLQ